MPTFSPSSKAQLVTCDVRLQTILNEAIKVVDFVVIKGFRNEEEQNKAFSEGKSQKQWPNGNHNKTPSKAVDIWPWTKEGKVDWKDVVAMGRLAGYIQRIAEERNVKLRFGVDWDGDWRTAGIADPNEHFLDAGHIEIVDII